MLGMLLKWHCQILLGNNVNIACKGCEQKMYPGIYNENCNTKGIKPMKLHYETHSKRCAIKGVKRLRMYYENHNEKIQNKRH